MSLGPFSIYCWRWGVWFRVFGYGLNIVRSKGYSPMFSERMGITKPLYIGPVRITTLKPSK